jgi:hypothetical protein
MGWRNNTLPCEIFVKKCAEILILAEKLLLREVKL